MKCIKYLNYYKGNIMFKKAQILIITAILGSVLAAILMYEFHYPEITEGLVICQQDLINSCQAVSQSQFSQIAGIPVAAFGFFFYLVVLFSILIADYAGGLFYRLISLPLLILSSMAIAADIFFAGAMIYIKQFCSLCAASYVLTIIIFIFSLLLYLDSRKNFPDKLTSLLKNFLTGDEKKSNRALIAVYTVFVFMMLFSITATNFVLESRSGSRPRVLSAEELNRELNEFYQEAPAVLLLPESNMKIGEDNAALKIYVFSDFLCGACYKFFELEKKLIVKFPGKIQFVYYNYPLDGECNANISNTVYDNSCLATASFILAADQGLFTSYLKEHFKNYNREFSHSYNEPALKLTTGQVKGLQIPYGDELLKSPIVMKKLTDDLKLAKQLSISSTPTIIINGRKMVGVPAQQVIEEIIKRELADKKQK